jgi:Uma2 family endonuclease
MIHAMSVATIAITPDAPLAARLEAEAGVEFVNGQVVEKNVSILGEITIASLTTFLGPVGRAAGYVLIGSALGYKIYPDDPARFRKPDLSLIQFSRLKGVDLDEGFAHIAPDIAVEVVSPTDSDYDVHNKVEEYLAHAVQQVWVVRPNVQTISIYRPDGGVTVFRAKDELVSELLPALRLKVREVFEMPAEPAKVS